MSRYTKLVTNHPVYGNFQLAWGYDRPLSEYFIQAFKLEENLQNDEEEETIFSISSYSTIVPHPKHPRKITWGRSEILDLIEDEKLPVPDIHKQHIALDLPF